MIITSIWPPSSGSDASPPPGRAVRRPECGKRPGPDVSCGAAGFLQATVNGRADEGFSYGGLTVHPSVLTTALLQAAAVIEYQVRADSIIRDPVTGKARRFLSWRGVPD